MKKHIIIITLAITAILLMAGCKKKKDETISPGSIYGCVTDFATGEPVRNANVQLRPSAETTLTGYDGMYEFLGVNNGDYSITVSKAEYNDLIDDYVISVRDGKRMKRDVQIKKTPTVLHIVDNNGNDITNLDFGADASVVTRTFNLFNNGTVTISCQIIYACNWIASVSTVPSGIVPGQTIPITVSINRAMLSTGLNKTILAITTNNGSAELTISAISETGNPPVVSILQASNITATSATLKGNIQNTNNGTVSDCGFCYSKLPNPSLNDDVIHLGPNTGTFTFTLTNLDHNTVYHAKAFVVTNIGIGYSSIIEFVTPSGLPICGTTTIIKYDPTTVQAQSTASGGNGYYGISEKGFCWSETPVPTINDNVVAYMYGGGDGAYHEYINLLQPNTSYHVRSYAKNIFGTSYGPEMTFTSLSGLATISTSSAYISGDYIITGGNVTDSDGTAVIDKGVCYGTSPNPDLSSYYEHTNDGYDLGSFTSTIPKPMNSGYLYIRAYATTKYGEAYGEQVSIFIP